MCLYKTYLKRVKNVQKFSQEIFFTFYIKCTNVFWYTSKLSRFECKQSNNIFLFLSAPI